MFKRILILLILCSSLQTVFAQDFSKDILKLDGLSYGYFSALQCAFKGISWIPNRKLHCSEIHPLMLKNKDISTALSAMI